jgi:hypothetical protein
VAIEAFMVRVIELAMGEAAAHGFARPAEPPDGPRPRLRVTGAAGLAAQGSLQLMSAAADEPTQTCSFCRKHGLAPAEILTGRRPSSVATA